MMYDFSVVIPTYNRINYLKQAIASCFDGNDEIAIEVIVVDDGSTDGTQEYLKENYLQFSQTGKSHIVNPIFQSHQGVQVARNQGLQLANGEFIKFLDDDDWLASGALFLEFERLKILNANICYGSYKTVNAEGNTLIDFSQDYPDDLMAAVLSRSITTCIFKFSYRRSFINDLFWSRETKSPHDFHFLASVALKEPKHVPSNVFVGYYRQHNGYREARRIRVETDPSLARVEIIQLFIWQLQEQNKLTDERLLAAVEGLWKCAHFKAAYDLNAFEYIFTKIENFIPGYLPKRPFKLLSIFDWILTPRIVEYIIYPIRYFKLRFVSKSKN